MGTKGKKRCSFPLFIHLSIFCLLTFVVNPRLTTAASGVLDFHYYYSLSTKVVTIRFEEDVSQEQMEALIRDDPVLECISDETLPFGLVLVVLKEDLVEEDIVETVKRLNKSPEIRYCTHVFEFQNLKLILKDEFIVRFKADLTEKDVEIVNKGNGVTIVRKSPYRHNRYVLRVMNPKDKSALEVANIYNANPRTEYATPNFIVLGGYCNTYPNDTYFGEQWALHNWGQVPPGGTPGADINAPEGWDINTGSSDIVIAIIDSGTDIDHEDLASKIWTNEAELNGDPNVDDDENGYVDDIYGWDFASGDNDPRGENYHGTACAGLAAADTNNATGVAGVCWVAEIMPLQIGTLGLEIAAATEAIDYAWANGADILSMSWVIPPMADLHDAIKAAKSNGRSGKGCVIIGAAGNDGIDRVSWPARYKEVVAVGATDLNDVRCEKSNYGDKLDVVAPSAWGEAIFWTTDISGCEGKNECNEVNGDPNGNYYKWFGGTSAATPEVAGLAGLILSVDANLAGEEVRWLMRNSCDDLGEPGWDEEYGSGRIDVYKALHGMTNVPSKATEPYPPNDANGIGVNVDLSWTAATGAFSHDVYFGTDFNDVNDANTSSDVFIGNQVENFFCQDTLELITTYYWRIDERNNEGTTTGDVWSFTTGLNLGIFYVDANADPNGDGNSWETAYNDLQDALEQAIWTGDEIWVAKGIYKPTDGNDREISFEPAKGIGLYGGFNGTESSRDERDPNLSANITTLSGDINEPNDANDNSYQVILSSDSMTLDRFTITNGCAVPGKRSGGGMVNHGVSSVTVTNCIFTANKANWCGAGMINNDSEVTISGCTFVANKALYWGGGMYNIGGNYTVSDCTFTENEGLNGGGISNFQCNIHLVNSVFSRNKGTGPYSGGGGGFEMSGSVLAIVTNCIFTENEAKYLGGGMIVTGVPWETSEITNCIFAKNKAYGAQGQGGGLFAASYSPTVTNCTFAENEAGDKGGGMFIWNLISSDVTNCIFWGNNASGEGNEIYNNTSDPNNDPRYCYCDIKDCYDSNGVWDANLGIDDGNNIDEDPCFVNVYDFADDTVDDGSTTTIVVADANLHEVNDVIEYDDDSIARTVTDVNTTTDIVTFANDPLDANSVSGVRIHNWGPGVTDVNEDYHIQWPGSSCIDEGDPNYVPDDGETDIDGQDRVTDGDGNGVSVVDMGADETPEVCQTCKGDLNGDGWVTMIDLGGLMSLLLQKEPIGPTDHLYNDCGDMPEHEDRQLTTDDYDELLAMLQAAGPPYKIECP